MFWRVVNSTRTSAGHNGRAIRAADQSDGRPLCDSPDYSPAKKIIALYSDLVGQFVAFARTARSLKFPGRGSNWSRICAATASRRRRLARQPQQFGANRFREIETRSLEFFNHFQRVQCPGRRGWGTPQPRCAELRGIAPVAG